MTQVTSIDRYITMVRELGIEEAYKQRFRATGVTFRAVMRAAHDISAGKRMVISDEFWQSRQSYFIRDVMEAMRSVQHELVCTEYSIHMPASGGWLVKAGYAHKFGMPPYTTLTII